MNQSVASANNVLLVGWPPGVTLRACECDCEAAGASNGSVHRGLPNRAAKSPSPARFHRQGQRARVTLFFSYIKKEEEAVLDAHSSRETIDSGSQAGNNHRRRRADPVWPLGENDFVRHTDPLEFASLRTINRTRQKGAVVAQTHYAVTRLAPAPTSFSPVNSDDTLFFVTCQHSGLSNPCLRERTRTQRSREFLPDMCTLYTRYTNVSSIM